LSAKRLRIRSEARDEFLRETKYYETQRIGSGKRFRESVRAALALIQHFPASGAPGPSGTRKTKVKGYPFTIVYRDEPTEIIIFAISPDRQQPGYWIPRLPDE
jgi:hypothetical protein